MSAINAIAVAEPVVEVKPVEEDSSRFFTDAKIKRCALIALAAVAAVSSFALVGAVIVGSVTFPFLAITIPLSFFAYQLNQNGLAIKDYEDPQELLLMKESAENMSFSSLRKEHRGLKNIVKYEIVSPQVLHSKFKEQYARFPLSYMMKDCRFSYAYILNNQLATREELTSKFYAEVAELSSIDELYANFSEADLENLSSLQVITSDKVLFFKDQQEQKNEAKKQRDGNLLFIDSLYAGRQERILLGLETQLKKLEKDLGNTHKKMQIAVPIHQDGLHKEVSKGQSVKRGSMSEQIDLIVREKARVIQDETGLQEQEQYDTDKRRIETSYATQVEDITSKFREYVLLMSVE